MLESRTFPTISSVAKDSGLTLHTAVITSPWHDNRPLSSPSKMASFLFLKRTVMRYTQQKKKKKEPRNGRG